MIVSTDSDLRELPSRDAQLPISWQEVFKWNEIRNLSSHCTSYTDLIVDNKCNPTLILTLAWIQTRVCFTLNSYTIVLTHYTLVMWHWFEFLHTIIIKVLFSIVFCVQLRTIGHCLEVVGYATHSCSLFQCKNKGCWYCITQTQGSVQVQYSFCTMEKLLLLIIERAAKTCLWRRTDINIGCYFQCWGNKFTLKCLRSAVKGIPWIQFLISFTYINICKYGLWKVQLPDVNSVSNCDFFFFVNGSHFSFCYLIAFLKMETENAAGIQVI